MSVLVKVHAVPNARDTALAGMHGDAVKIRLAAKPEDGAANAELLRFLAKLLELPKNSLRLKRGASSREKLVEIDDATAQERLSALANR